MLRTASRKTAAVAAAGAAALGLTLALAASGPAAAAAPLGRRRPPTRSAPTPTALHTAAEIHRFLSSFYGHHGPGAWAREHQVSDYLKDRAAHTEGYDLLLCAQNTPREITIGKVTTAQSAGCRLGDGHHALGRRAAQLLHRLCGPGVPSDPASGRRLRAVRRAVRPGAAARCQAVGPCIRALTQRIVPSPSPWTYVAALCVPPGTI